MQLVDPEHAAVETPGGYPGTEIVLKKTLWMAKNAAPTLKKGWLGP